MKLIKSKEELNQFILDEIKEQGLMPSDELIDFEPREYPFLMSTSCDLDGKLYINIVVYKSDFEVSDE